MEWHWRVPGGGGGPIRPTEPNLPPPQLELKQHTGLLTDFKKEMKQSEFHPGKLVMVQVAVHALLLKQQRVMDTC